MSEIINHDWENVGIRQRKSDGYVSLTDIAQTRGKFAADYLKIKTTKEFLQALSADLGIPEMCRSDTESSYDDLHNCTGQGFQALVVIYQGANHELQGTWVHPDVGIDACQWVNVQMRIWANRTLRTVIERGGVILDQDKYAATASAEELESLRAALDKADRMLAGKERALKLLGESHKRQVEYGDSIAADLDQKYQRFIEADNDLTKCRAALDALGLEVEKLKAGKATPGLGPAQLKAALCKIEELQDEKRILRWQLKMVSAAASRVFF